MPTTNPTRKGYVFGGWYTTEECDTEFDLDTPITKDTKVFAKWTEAEDTTYTVIIWKQKVSDDKNASKKTYDYEESAVLTGKTSTSVDTTSAALSPYFSKTYAGFHYGTYDIKDGKGATWNGKALPNFQIPVKELKKGGELVFHF